MSDDETKRQRGRPALSPEQRKPRKKVRNVTLDAETADRLNQIAVSMEHELGFAPTLSQTLLRLIAVYERQLTKPS
jgi:hypothetical protein